MTPTDGRSTGHQPGPVAIAIVGFRDASEVQQCIAILGEGSHTDFVVVICENGGRESFEGLIRALSSLAPEEAAPPSADPVVTDVWRGRLRGGQVIEALCAADNLGYAGGVNTAIRRAGVQFSDWSALWVLNADTEPHRDALAALVRKLQSDPGFGVIGSRLVLTSTGRVQAYGGRWRELLARCRNIGWDAPHDAPVDERTVERELSYVLGASMLVSRAFVETVGGMVEDYFLYCEEVDWCLRRRDFRLGYAHASIIMHRHGAMLGSDDTRRRKSKLSVYLDERNKHLIARRFFPRSYPIVIVSTLALTALYLRSRSLPNFMVALRGWGAGVRGETGRPAGL